MYFLAIYILYILVNSLEVNVGLHVEGIAQFSVLVHYTYTTLSARGEIQPIEQLFPFIPSLTFYLLANCAKCLSPIFFYRFLFHVQIYAPKNSFCFDFAIEQLEIDIINDSQWWLQYLVLSNAIKL